MNGIRIGVTIRDGRPFIETQARFEGGKIRILRTPILPPGASDAQIEALTEREVVDAI
jgi:hypothetical protein